VIPGLGQVPLDPRHNLPPPAVICHLARAGFPQHPMDDAGLTASADEILPETAIPADGRMAGWGCLPSSTRSRKKEFLALSNISLGRVFMVSNTATSDT